MANDILYDPVRSIIETEPQLLDIFGRLIECGYTRDNIIWVFDRIEGSSKSVRRLHNDVALHVC